MKKQEWRRFNGNRLLLPIEEEVKQILGVENERGATLSVCIGSDSQVKPTNIEFATAIVFVKKGQGAYMLVRKEAVQLPFTIKERMLAEVQRSIDVAYSLREVFAGFNITPEIHLDINKSEIFKSNLALKEAAGYVSGMGFNYKIKPEAFASSVCANRMVQ